jgi:uncharacterized protein (DUF983 family)
VTLLLGILSLRCPHCGKGSICGGLFKTLRFCPACGADFESEAGFYAGAIYPLYGLAALVGGLVALAGIFILGLSPGASVALGCLGVALASPYLFWLSRSAFLHSSERFFKRLGK